MTPKSQRLLILLFFLVLLFVAVFLILKSLEDNIVYFFSPTEIKDKIIKNDNKLTKNIRVGGLVKKNSVFKNGKKVIFKISDGSNEIVINYEGILPDLFREGQGVVAFGKVNKNSFKAIEILAKHDENYMPKEVSDMLKINGIWKGNEN